MKILCLFLLLNSFLYAFETYPYVARERESLGTILYSIGAKRLWGAEGSVKKHATINQIKTNHEFKDQEMIRLAKEDIRFKCNVILKGDVLVIKRALITKKDRAKLLAENPNCLKSEITQLATKKVKVYASTRDYLKKKTKKYKKEIIPSVPHSTTPKNISVKTSTQKSWTPKLKADHRISYISTRNSLNYKVDNSESIQTVANSNIGFLYEHMQRENGKGLMANFSIALMQPDSNPNYDFNTQGELSYELGYNFNDKFILATGLKLSQAQYQVSAGELSDINFTQFMIRSIYRTNFFKKENLISLSTGGVQADNGLKGYALGLRSEVLASEFSFSVFYDHKTMYADTEELSQNLFGLSIGKVF